MRQAGPSCIPALRYRWLTRFFGTFSFLLRHQAMTRPTLVASGLKATGEMAVAVATVLALVAPNLAYATSPPMIDVRSERVVVGTVEVHAPPVEVLDALQDLERWSAIFSDVRGVREVRREAGAMIASVDLRSIGHYHTYRLTSPAGGPVHLEILDGHFGTQLQADFAVSPSAGGSLVVGTFDLDPGYLVGLILTDAELDRRRRAKVEQDLLDLAAHFER